MGNVIEIKNKKADFQYFLFDTVTAGIQLSGTEIKSIRAGKASVVDAYCQFKGHELFVINLHIAEYTHGNIYNHEPRRDRKLLMTKRELKKMQTKIKERGYTIIPTMLFINEEGKAKLNIALARGKKMYDKRESIKEKDNRREMEREEH